MIIHVVLLIVGFGALMEGANVFVEGASSLALKLHIPQIVVGLTVVAFGTSAPEAAISLTSAMEKSCDLAIGNVIGSNILNVLLILGVAGCLSQLVVQKTTYHYEIPFVLLMTLLLLILGEIGHRLDWKDGLIFVICFIAFLTYLVIVSRRSMELLEDCKEEKIFVIFIELFLGISGIILGSMMTIHSANHVALDFGLSKRFIGLTIVSFGTSLPELVTSIIASLKGKNDLCIGNIIGSNIFNILFVLGFTSLMTPVVFINDFINDGVVAIAALMLLMIFIDKNYRLKKRYAFLMVVFYIIYFILVSR